MFAEADECDVTMSLRFLKVLRLSVLTSSLIKWLRQKIDLSALLKL